MGDSKRNWYAFPFDSYEHAVSHILTFDFRKGI